MAAETDQELIYVIRIRAFGHPNERTERPVTTELWRRLAHGFDPARVEVYSAERVEPVWIGPGQVEIPLEVVTGSEVLRVPVLYDAVRRVFFDPLAYDEEHAGHDEILRVEDDR